MKKDPIRLDERRLLALPGDAEETIAFALDNWLEIAAESIADHDFFAVALSGGSTPKKIFKALSRLPDRIDWSKVYLFWGDERNVVPTDPESNYHMALEEGKLKHLPLLKEHVFRMVAEENLQINARAYQALIESKLGSHPFDLVMLGMGDDGHTASLFPHTKALHEMETLVVANEVPQKKTWRMSLTYPCINRARHINLYVLGASKAKVLKDVLTSALDFEKYPSQNIGTHTNPALWIADIEASEQILAEINPYT